MFSHIFVGTNDFERALAFYRPLLDALGIRARFCDADKPWAGWQSSPDPRPLFLIGCGTMAGAMAFALIGGHA